MLGTRRVEEWAKQVEYRPHAELSAHSGGAVAGGRLLSEEQEKAIIEKHLRRAGLHAAFQSVFPIKSYSGHATLEYVYYYLGEPVFDVKECQVRGLTYAAPIRVRNVQVGVMK